MLKIDEEKYSATQILNRKSKKLRQKEILCYKLFGCMFVRLIFHNFAMTKIETSSLAKDIQFHENRPPPPLKKIRNKETGFPTVKPIEQKIKIVSPQEPEKPITIDQLEDVQQEFEEENQNDKPFADTTPRYDFDGKDISHFKGSDLSYLKGLHQHNDSEDKPGYALYELAVLCRSYNTSQRSVALNMVANIIEKNQDVLERDIKEAQIPIIAISALFPPNNFSVKTAAMDIISKLLIGKFVDPFSIYPYPAISPETPLTFEISKFHGDLIEAATKEPKIMDYLALIASKSTFELTKLISQPPSTYLFHLSRSAYINWGEIFAKQQAISTIDKLASLETMPTEQELEIYKEAAVVLMFIKEIPDLPILDKLPPIIVAILLSRITKNVEKYHKYLPMILELCPDPFALSFVAACTLQDGLVTKDQAIKAVKNASFSPAVVTLKKFIATSEGKEFNLVIPMNLPEDIESCWKNRDVICGYSEYILQTRSYQFLPKLLPCLFNFTNPAADMLIETIFGFSISKERPVDPTEIFEHLADCKPEQIKRILTVAIHFPLHYIIPLFDREDEPAISSIICDYLDHFPDPLPPSSLRPLDTSKYFERFLFDCFSLPSYQKLIFFIISKGSDPEVRQHFWTNCSKYLSRISMKNVRKDVINDPEDDQEILSCIIHALRESREVENDILNIAINNLKTYLMKHKGEMSGEVFLEHVKRLPEFWSSKILSFLK